MEIQTQPHLLALVIRLRADRQMTTPTDRHMDRYPCVLGPSLKGIQTRCVLKAFHDLHPHVSNTAQFCPLSDRWVGCTPCPRPGLHNPGDLDLGLLDLNPSSFIEYVLTLEKFLNLGASVSSPIKRRE